MGRSRLPILLVAVLLAFSVSNGFGRKLMEESGGHGDSSVQVVPEESVGKSRVIIQLMDYSDPEPNINPKTGALLNPPPSPSVG